MRKIPLAIAAILFAAPAAQAQSSPSFPEEMDEEIVRSLPSPGEVEDMAATVGRAAEALLDVPIGGVVRAIDPHRRGRRDETVGEVIGRGDPYVRERLRDSAQGLAIDMEDVIARVAVVAPALRRSLADLERNLGRALRDGRGVRDHDPPDADDDYRD